MNGTEIGRCLAGSLRVDMPSSTIGKAPTPILELGARLECWVICWRFNLVSHSSFIFRLVDECSLGELDVDRNDLDYLNHQTPIIME